MKKYFLVNSIILALSLTACGEDNNQTTASKNINEINDTITIGNGTEPGSLDPHKVNGVPEIVIIRQMLEGLTTTDVDGKTIPAMAKSWQTDDNKTWVFHLRDAKWSNGDEVTADDFVYSFIRLIDPQTASPNASTFIEMHVINAEKILEGKLPPKDIAIKAINSKTLEFKLDKPIPYLPEMLVGVSTFPVNKKAIETYGDKWTQPNHYISNGAYNLSEWKINDKIILTKNKLYYDSENTKINNVIVLPIVSQTAELNRFATGDLDMTSDLPNNQYEDIVKKYPQNLKISPSLCTYYYELNLNKPPFNDVKVRKALSLITDREIFANKIAGKGEIAAYQYTPINMANVDPYVPTWKHLSKSEKIEQAKQLLAEAGYSENNPLKFELLYNTSENHKKSAIAVSSMWKQAIPYIQVELNNQEWKVYLESRQEQKMQMARAGACADYNEQSALLNSCHSKSAGNYPKYNNPKYDELLANTLAPGLTKEQRAQNYKKAEEMLDQDAVQINIFHYVNTRLVSDKLKGYSLKDAMDNYQFKYWSIKNDK